MVLDMTTSQVNGIIPEAIFQAPDYAAAAETSLREYTRAVAQCIMLAASKGMAEPDYLFRPGRPRSDLTKLDGATRLLDLLVESDRNARAWYVVNEWLSPEINHCVTAIRKMQGRSAQARADAEHLAVLRGIVQTYG